MFVKSIRENLQNSKSHRSCKGYTLVELIIAVSVIGVLITYAVPGFRGMVDQAQYNRLTGTLAKSLSIARNEAVFKGKNVIVCATPDPAAAEPLCSTDQSDWSNGWIVFQNCNSNLTREIGASLCDLDGDGTAESAEAIIKTFPATRFSLTKTANTACTASTASTATASTAVSFRASGMSDSGANFCVFINSKSGTVTVSRLARIETSTSQ